MADESKSKGDKAFSTGKLSDAISHFSSAINLAPTDPLLYVSRSASYALLDNFTESLHDAHKIVTLNPDSPEGYMWLGTSYYGLQSYNDAIKAYKKGLEVDPNSNALKSGLSVAQSAAASEKMIRIFSKEGHVVYDLVSSLKIQPSKLITPASKFPIQKPKDLRTDDILPTGLYRRIVANSTFVCYAPAKKNICIMNPVTQVIGMFVCGRVSDMAFFGGDGQLLASVSVDGNVLVLKLDEGGLHDKGNLGITQEVILDITIRGVPESVHPRICWHPKLQNVCLVSIGKHVLKIDTSEGAVGKRYHVGRGHEGRNKKIRKVNKLADGVQVVQEHDKEVSDLSSICQGKSSYWVSASIDGTVKIWEDGIVSAPAVLQPHDGQPVSSAIWLVASDGMSNFNLITTAMSYEIKIWSCSSREKFSDAESWKCTQTLKLEEPVNTRGGDAVLCKVLGLPHAGLILVANARKKVLYAIHIEQGTSPATTRMDYITKITVDRPILSLSEPIMTSLSFSGFSCIQMEEVRQYELNMSQRLLLPLPLPEDIAGVNHASEHSPDLEPKNIFLAPATTDSNHVFEASPHSSPLESEASSASAPSENVNAHDASSAEALEEPQSAITEDVQNSGKDMPQMVFESTTEALSPEITIPDVSSTNNTQVAEGMHEESVHMGNGVALMGTFIGSAHPTVSFLEMQQNDFAGITEASDRSESVVKDFIFVQDPTGDTSQKVLESATKITSPQLPIPTVSYTKNAQEEMIESTLGIQQLLSQNKMIVSQQEKLLKQMGTHETVEGSIRDMHQTLSKQEDLLKQMLKNIAF